MKNWAFCPWSAKEFVDAKTPAIKAFIASVKRGQPDFSLFRPAAEYLAAIAILAQGYLCIVANQQADIASHDAAIPGWRLLSGKTYSKETVELVNSSSYWSVFGKGKNSAEVGKAVKEEWRRLGGGEPDLELVNALIEAALQDSRKVALDAKVVLAAYKAAKPLLEKMHGS